MLKYDMSFKSTLSAKLMARDELLPLSANATASMIQLLDECDHTYLSIEDCLCVEVVKLTNKCGILVATRGVDGSQPRSFPKGACVKPVVTPSTVIDLIQQQADNAEE